MGKYAVKCQHVVVPKSRAVRISEGTRQCRNYASWNVAVFANPKAKPLAASNYDTTKVSHDYFLCGVHAESMLNKFHNYSHDVWHAKGTRLGH